MLAGCICALLSEVAAPVVSHLPQAPAQPGAPLKDIFLDSWGINLPSQTFTVMGKSFAKWNRYRF